MDPAFYSTDLPYSNGTTALGVTNPFWLDFRYALEKGMSGIVCKSCQKPLAGKIIDTRKELLTVLLSGHFSHCLQNMCIYAN